MVRNTNLHVVMYDSETAKLFEESEMNAIVTAAELYNSAHEITGVLLYADSKWTQILEGPKDELQDLMKRIKKDTRHRNLRVYLDEPLPARNFASWSMGSVLGGVVSDVYRLSLPKIFEFAVESYKRAR